MLQHTATPDDIMVLFPVNLYYTIPQNKPVRPRIMRIDPIQGVAPESRTVETGRPGNRMTHHPAISITSNAFWTCSLFSA